MNHFFVIRRSVYIQLDHFRSDLPNFSAECQGRPSSYRKCVLSALERVQAYCLSPAVEDKISALAWAGVRVAEKPDQHSMLVLIGTGE